MDVKKLFGLFDLLVYWVETLVSTLSLIAITVIVFVQVGSRYLFSTSLSWGEEVIILLILTMAMYGAARGVRSKAHTEVSGVASALPKFGKYLLRAFTTFVTLAIILLTVYGSFFLAQRTKSVSMMLRFPQKWYYLALGTGAALMFYEYLKVVKARIEGRY